METAYFIGYAGKPSVAAPTVGSAGCEKGAVRKIKV